MKFISVLIVALYLSSIQTKLITFIEKFELCYLKKDGPIWVGNVSVNKSRNENSIVSGEGEFYRDIDSKNIQILINATKCSGSRELLDFCEPFQALKPTNPCLFLNLRHVAWEPFVYGFVPPFKCPFKKGKITAYNVTIDGNIFELYPIKDINWKLEFVFFENNIMLMKFCADIIFISRT